MHSETSNVGASEESEHAQDQVSGAGLYRLDESFPAPKAAGKIIGALGLLVLVGSFVLLVSINGAFASGKSGGTANQIGKLPGAVAPPVEIVAGSPAALGRQTIGKYGCGTCHTIPGIPTAKGNIGPNLGGVASRTKIAGGAVPNSGPEDLKKWILDPGALKPGTAMPRLGLTPEEADSVVAFLETLK